MAQATDSLNCPACGTFNAVSGKVTDEHLSNQCGGCGRPVSKPNPHYVKPSAAVMPPPTETVIYLQNEDGSIGTITISGYATITIDNVPNQVQPENEPDEETEPAAPAPDGSAPTASAVPAIEPGGAKVPPPDADRQSNDVIPPNKFETEGLNVSGAVAEGDATIKPVEKPTEEQPVADA